MSTKNISSFTWFGNKKRYFVSNNVRKTVGSICEFFIDYRILDGFTRSDIKEAFCEAIVEISHEQAQTLDLGITYVPEWDKRLDWNEENTNLQRLRPVTMKDFF